MIAGIAGSILAEGMDELITRSEESCRVCVETSKLRRPIPNLACWALEKINKITKKDSAFQTRIIDLRNQPFVRCISVVESGYGRTNRRTHLVNKIPENKLMPWNLKNYSY